jgi:hypothetical protein
MPAPGVWFKDRPVQSWNFRPADCLGWPFCYYVSGPLQGMLRTWHNLTTKRIHGTSTNLLACDID